MGRQEYGGRRKKGNKMLRRITAYSNIIAILLVSLVPLQATTKVKAQTKSSTTTIQNSKLAPEFQLSSTTNTRNTQALGGATLVRVIVQSKSSTATAQNDAVASVGGVTQQSYQTLNTFVADVPLNQLAVLAAREDVVYVSPDRPVKAALALTRETTGVDQVQGGNSNSTQLTGFTGKGVTIAVIDSGISYTHPDFAKNKNQSRIITRVDFTDRPMTGDPYGHGTGVASVAAGGGAGSVGYGANYRGVAPDANLVDLRALDENGAGTTSSVLRAVNWAIQNRARYGINVINISLGTPVHESWRKDPLCVAVARAVNAGIVVVASAGNTGRTDEVVGYDAQGNAIHRLVYGSVGSPGNSPYVITVGATDSHGTAKRSDDTVAEWSSKGPTQFDHLAKPDLLAPGRRVIAPMSQEWNAALPIQFPEKIVHPVTGGTDNAYFTYSGTSFSAPVVAGTVALMLQANKSLTPLLVKAILTRTAQQLPGFTNKAQSVLSQGAGLVNATSAVEMSRAIVPNAGSLHAGDRIFTGNTTLSSMKASYTIGREQVARSNRVLSADGAT